MPYNLKANKSLFSWNEKFISRGRGKNFNACRLFCPLTLAYIRTLWSSLTSEEFFFMFNFQILALSHSTDIVFLLHEDWIYWGRDKEKLKNIACRLRDRKNVACDHFSFSLSFPYIIVVMMHNLLRRRGWWQKVGGVGGTRSRLEFIDFLGSERVRVKWEK